MNLFKMAWKSIQNRKFGTIATVISIALSLLLLFTIERGRRSLENSFTQTVSGVHLLVGARSGTLQLVLYSVFNIGQATNNVSIETYEKIKSREDVEWVIPYSLGDGHRGFRVVATDENFFQHYRFQQNRSPEFQEGVPFKGYFDVVLGSDVAETLKYKLEDSIVIAHGSTTGDSFSDHADKPFKVVGILKPTGTALDRSIYISLAGMEAIHIDWKSGAAPRKGEEIAVDQLTDDMLKPKSITSFFVKLKSPIQVLALQREINESTEEALMAVMPSAVLAEFWQTLSQVERLFKWISSLVLIVGLISMLISIFTTLNYRRREFAILRAIGAGLGDVMKLIVIEIFLILSVSIATAVVLKLGVEFFLMDFISKKTGLIFDSVFFSGREVIMMGLTLGVGLVLAVIPAFEAKRSALKDGLTVRV